MFDKINWFGKTKNTGKIIETETPFSEENYQRELNSFLHRRVGNTWLTEAGQESLLADINEHISNGVAKEEVFNDLKKLSRDLFVSKYSIDRRTVDEKVLEEINTAMLRISGTLRSKGFTESAVELLFAKAQDEIVDDSEAFERKLKNMSSDEINKIYLQ